MSVHRPSEGYFNHETNIIIEYNRNPWIHTDINEYEGEKFIPYNIMSAIKCKWSLKIAVR